jgi:pSer/pThr/pTyr-binding forkhead associated (FHA) protein
MTALGLRWQEADRTVILPLPDDRTLVLGRDPACDLVFEDLSVSRRHCEIVPDGAGGWVLKHLSYKNPTWLNGTLVVDEAPLAAGDVLQLTVVEVRVVDAVGAAGED